MEQNWFLPAAEYFTQPEKKWISAPPRPYNFG